MNSKDKNKIKIVYIMPTLDQGGAERFLIDLITNLDQNIFSPSLILYKRGGQWLNELKKNNIPVKIFSKKYKLDFYNFWQIIKTLQKIKPQIIHTQLGADLYGRLAGKLLKIPIIINTEQNINKDEYFIHNFLHKITNHWSTKIVAISQAVKNDIITRYQANPKKILVIPNGLKIDKFLSKNTNPNLKNINSENKEKITFGTIGRLNPQKGQSNLIQAWTKLKNTNINCLIAGTGLLKNSLNQQIEKHGLTERIKLVGAVNSVDFLESLDAFILPSIWEGQGIVLLEAGLKGLPIIASNVDGIKELITEKTGWLFPAEDSSALALKIDWLTKNLNSSEVKNKIKNLQSVIINNYDIKKITNDYENLYQSLLDDREAI